MILKLKNLNCAAIKVLSLDVYIEKVLVSNKIFSEEKKYKWFIGYLYDDPKVKPLRIMPPKTTVYVKS